MNSEFWHHKLSQPVAPPGLKSVAETKRKAKNYAAHRLDHTDRALAKQAILRELNSQLSIKPIRRASDLQHTRRRPHSLCTNVTTDKDLCPPGKTPLLSATSRNQSECKKVSIEDQVKEIHVHYLTKKYGKLWMRAVFGRIPPQVVRHHFNLRLLREVFARWQEIWWNSRRGWKLSVRADYHNRVRMWYKVLGAWKQYVQMQRRKSRMFTIAQHHSAVRVEKRVFAVWKRYMLVMKQHVAKVSRKRAKRNLVILRRQWQKWTLAFQSRRLEKAMELTCLRHWAMSLKRKFFNSWITAYGIACDLNVRLAFAASHSNRVVAKKCLRGWTDFILARKQKKSYYRYADAVAWLSLLRRSTKIWYKALLVKTNEHAMAEKILAYGTSSSKRRFFRKWVSYIYSRRLDAAKLTAAEGFRQMKLKALAIKRMQAAVATKKLLTGLRQRADAFHFKYRISSAWKHWLYRCEHSEELKLFPMTRIARTYFSTHVLREFFRCWRKYVSARKQSRANYHQANMFYQRTALPVFFERWIIFVRAEKEKRESCKLALEFSRELLYAKHFYTWLKTFRSAQSCLIQIKVAVSFAENALKRKYLHAWVKKFQLCVLHNGKMEHSTRYYHRKQKIRSFRFLKFHAQLRKMRRQKFYKAVALYQSRSLRLTFTAWMKFHQAMKRRKLNHYRAIWLYNSKLCRLTFSAWKVYHCQQLQILAEVNARWTQNNDILLRWAFQKWKANAGMMKRKNALLKDAVARKLHRIKRRVFLTWHQYTLTQAEKKFTTQSQLSKAGVHLQASKLRRCFQRWRSRSVHQAQDRQRCFAANNHYYMKLQKMVIGSWRLHVVQGFRKKLLRRQSIFFYVSHSERKFFACWMQQLLIRKHERSKTAVALWWWSSHLQRKSLSALHVYAKAKKQRKADINAALAFRRSLLVEKGVLKWIQYASDMMQLRSKMCSQRLVEISMALHNRVRRYAMHWYWVSKRRRALKSQVSTGIPDLTSKVVDCKTPVVADVNRAVVRPRVSGIRLRPSPRRPDYLREPCDLRSNVVKATEPVHSRLTALGDDPLERVSFNADAVRVDRTTAVLLKQPKLSCRSTAEASPIQIAHLSVVSSADEQPELGTGSGKRLLHPVVISKQMFDHLPRDHRPVPVVQSVRKSPLFAKGVEASLRLSSEDELGGDDRTQKQDKLSKDVNRLLLPPSTFAKGSTLTSTIGRLGKNATTIPSREMPGKLPVPRLSLDVDNRDANSSSYSGTLDCERLDRNCDMEAASSGVDSESADASESESDDHDDDDYHDDHDDNDDDDASRDMKVLAVEELTRIRNQLSELKSLKVKHRQVSEQKKHVDLYIADLASSQREGTGEVDGEYLDMVSQQHQMNEELMQLETRLRQAPSIPVLLRRSEELTKVLM